MWWRSSWESWSLNEKASSEWIYQTTIFSYWAKTTHRVWYQLPTSWTPWNTALQTAHITHSQNWNQRHTLSLTLCFVSPLVLPLLQWVSWGVDFHQSAVEAIPHSFSNMINVPSVVSGFCTWARMLANMALITGRMLQKLQRGEMYGWKVILPMSRQAILWRHGIAVKMLTHLLLIGLNWLYPCLAGSWKGCAADKHLHLCHSCSRNLVVLGVSFCIAFVFNTSLPTCCG